MIPIERVEKLDPARLLRRDAQAEADVSAAVDDVIETVRTRGDEALRDYTRRFDGAELTDLRVTEAEIQAAWEATDADFRQTLELAAENIRTFHSRQIHSDFVLTREGGIVMGQRYTPIEKVGVCVPRSPVAFTPPF